VAPDESTNTQLDNGHDGSCKVMNEDTDIDKGMDPPK
jgi:hypothetical protein